MGLTSFSFVIDGQTIPPPRDWAEIQILSTFDNEAVQANISTEQFSFVNEGARILIDYVENGKTGGVGIFEGLPIQISATDSNNSFLLFDGFINFDTYEQITPVEVKVSIKKLNGMNSFSERAEATTYSYLETKGLFPKSEAVNIPYVVEKEVAFLEILMVSMTLYNMISALIDSIKSLANNIANVVKAATPDASIPPIPNVGAIVSAILLIIVDIITIALLVIAITELFIQFLESLVSPVRLHATSSQRTLLEKATNFLGYDFVSPIAELDQIYYLASAPTEDEPITIGIPRAADFGYRVSEQFEIAQKLYNAKIAIIGNEVHLRTRSDPFWIQNSTYILPDLLDEGREYNTDDLKANRLISFATDISDEYTIDNFRGTVYEVITEPISTNNKEMILIKGLDEIAIPLALGSRKNGLTDLEQVLKSLALFIDALVGSSNAKKIDQRVGMLKLSGRIHRTAKLIPFIGAVIPKDPRDILGAKAIYDKFIIERSFVSDNFKRQRRVFIEVPIPFGFSDFLKLINNSYFVSQNGGSGKVLSLKWTLASDTAIVTYEVEEIYTKNLQEITVEPT